MKNFWKVTLPNKIIYIRGKKAQILIQFHTIVSLERINEKQLFEVLEKGVTTI